MKEAKVIAVCNQKGGVGKTTTTLNLGVGLANKGKSVLLIDTDPQGDLTTSLGWTSLSDEQITIADIMMAIIKNEAVSPTDGILHHEEGVDLLPANLDLCQMELVLAGVMFREKILKNYIDLMKGKYDYILLDCSPSLGLITVNVLTAANSVVIPVQANYLPAKGMSQLLGTVRQIQTCTNSDLKVEGILITLADRRSTLPKEVDAVIRHYYGSRIRIYDTKIPLAVSAARATETGKSIYQFDKFGTVAQAYEMFTKEVLECEKREKTIIQSSREL